jgi:CRP-like cAMP-binding protein
MTAQTESDDGDVIRSWAPQAIIFEHDSSSFEAYLVLEGEVEIFAPLGLKLNMIGQGEIFGEASMLLNTKDQLHRGLAICR